MMPVVLFPAATASTFALTKAAIGITSAGIETMMGPLIAAIAVPVVVAGFSPYLAWRSPIYIAAGFAGIIAPPDASQWGFTADGTPPTVSSMNPVADATGVSTGADLELTFDEDAQLGTGAITIHLASDDSVYGGGSVYRFRDVKWEAFNKAGHAENFDQAAFGMFGHVQRH